MRKILAVAASLFLVAGLFANPPAKPTAPTKDQTALTEAEAAFLSDGPRLYPMDKAQALSEKTGKPVFCWVGKHIFADERARDASKMLGETTMQAAMDTDGTEYDSVGPRVKFTSSNYAEGSTTYYVPVAKLTPTIAKKLLAVSRGASPESVGLKAGK